MRSFSGRDILSLKGFERAEYFRLFEICDELAPYARNRRSTDLCSGKILVTAFYQPSTRTRLATEAAMHRLGGGGRPPRPGLAADRAARDGQRPEGRGLGDQGHRRAAGRPA